MVNRVVASDEVRTEALALAAKICANAPLAVRESLHIARRSVDLTDEQLVALGTEARARLIETDDYKEGPRAFIERRAPRWTGT
jgi:enoyl-CoA hydratase/carnithine racemase